MTFDTVSPWFGKLVQIIVTMGFLYALIFNRRMTDEIMKFWGYPEDDRPLWRALFLFITGMGTLLGLGMTLGFLRGGP